MFFKKKISMLLAVMSTVLALHAQEVHFADVQQMKQWYNQSLKTDREKEFNCNFRNIKYQNLLAFKTGTILLNVPMVKKEYGTAGGERSFVNLSAGASHNQSNAGTYKNTVGLLGLSYARQLTADKIYVSAGFQGNFTNTRFNNTGIFPDQLDEYGPISGRISDDPLRGGKTYSFFSLNAGLGLFKNNENVEWYAGGSVRHVNKPFTEETKSASSKMAPIWGVQGSVKFKTSESIVDLYSIINWKAGANEYLGGIRYNFLLSNNDDDNINGDKSAFGVGCAYRFKDAFIPSISVGYRKTVINFYYDMNTSGIRSNSFTRTGYELALTQKF